MALEKLPKKYLPLVSSLFGAGGVLAILYGVVIGTLTRNDTASVLLIGSATAVALALPAAFMKEDVVTTEHLDATTAKTRLSRPFIYFLIATASSLAVSAMANDYFYQLSSRIQGLSKAEVTSNSQLLFAISALAFLVSTLSFGIFARSAKLPFRVFVGSLVLSAAGLISLALSSDPVALGFGAAVIGIGTGANIAAQFPVLRGLFSNDQELGSQAGIFNMVGVLPSIAVPALGALLVTVSEHNWPLILGFSIAALALGSAFLAAKRVPRGH
jgi:MFS family permease